MIIFKVLSMGRMRLSADFQLAFRLLKLFMFVAFVVILILAVKFLELTVGDIFASLLAFLPTGWFLLLVWLYLKLINVICIYSTKLDQVITVRVSVKMCR